MCERVATDGQVLAPLLPATGMVFTEGRISVAHAEAIAAVLAGPAARRLDPGVWAGAEEQIAAYAVRSGANPTEVAGWARQLIDALDQDGAEPAVEPDQLNELHLTRNRCGTGGRIKGELDGPTFEAVTTAIGALVKPHPDETRTLVDARPTRWARSASSPSSTTRPCLTPAGNAPRSGSRSTGNAGVTPSPGPPWIPGPGTPPANYGCSRVTAA